MNVILLSGGSGQRLWPLSNTSLSKQFLRLLKSPAGEYESMLQRMLRQLQNLKTENQIVIATNQKQVDVIRSQAGDKIELVLEPERRNTFPAILLACAYLYFKKGVQIEEPILVLPVDPYTEQSYFELLHKLEEGVWNGCADLVLMGTKPTYASAKYGYIIPSENQFHPDFKCVASFVEKPSEEEAQKLIDKGALWNCGVFAFSLQYIMDIIQFQIKVNTYEELLKEYATLEQNSFDYVVVEKAKSVCAVQYDGEWIDLGTWNTLTDKMPDMYKGHVCTDETTENTHIINTLDIPVLAMGAKDMVIVASHDGILITDKDRSSSMKPFVEQLESRPMFEERRWGEYQVIDMTACSDGTKSLTKHLTIKAGKQISYQYHRFRSEFWTIIAGKGVLYLDGQCREVGQGDAIKIQPECRHAIRAITDLDFIEVQIGTRLEEGDIVRLPFSEEKSLLNV